MNIVYRGKLKRLEFTFAVGDLFDADVESIVNSENTGFVLSRNTRSVSGQIRRRFGAAIQHELEELTRGHVLHPGTVLDTAGGTEFARIFHAGFHEPNDWPGKPGKSSEADCFEAIGSCIRQVLEAVRSKQLKSVAFPLIGCGLYGLDERMLFLQFRDAIESLDERMGEGESLNVWLVIRDQRQFQSIVGSLFSELVQHRTAMASVQMPGSGVPILDRFAARLAQPTNRDWAKWQLIRFTEIAVDIMCYAQCRAMLPTPTPESMFEEGKPASFGLVREHAATLASRQGMFADVWGAAFFASILNNRDAALALNLIITQRNNLAHGRQTLALDEVRGLVERGLTIAAWRSISESQGDPQLESWAPWMTASSTASGETGLFDRWQKSAIRYLVPETGEVFSMPRKLA